MNNEIKEILEQLEWYRKIGKKDVYYPECVLPNKKAFLLLDYITNLQHQISLMEEDIRESKEINGELQQENERLKHQLEVQQDLTIKNRLRKHIYKSRCEKAIDKLRRDYYTNYSQHNDDVVREALNILQNGSDNK